MGKEFHIYPQGYDKRIEITSPYLETDITGTGVIFQEGEKILLHLRDKKSGIRYSNKWSVFGGRAKPGETLYETARREIYEETDAVLDDAELKPFIDFIEYNPQTKKDEGSHLFLVDVTPHIEKMALKGEGRDMHSFSRKEMRELSNLVPYLDKYFDVWWDAVEQRT